MAIDMDVDASDNIYIWLHHRATGLDPGPNTTLVNPGKVYAKYNSTGRSSGASYWRTY